MPYTWDDNSPTPRCFGTDQYDHRLMCKYCTFYGDCALGKSVNKVDKVMENILGNTYKNVQKMKQRSQPENKPKEDPNPILTKRKIRLS